MKILVTGARGFVGKNLVQTLKTIRDGKNHTHQLVIDAVYEYDLNTAPAMLEEYCKKADFVFHLAGVNRPKDASEFMTGNYDFASVLLQTLKRLGNRCPVMMSSSVQASLIGCYGQSDYGKSKLAGEELFFSYGRETAADVLVYRFPNLFGKWCKPNYNSVVATWCHHMAHGLPIQISDPAAELELVYIDDLVEEMLLALEGRPHRCNYDGLHVIPGERYCYVPVSHRVKLGRIAELLTQFQHQPKSLVIPTIAEGSFEKKLYSTYLSYLPREKTAFPLKMNVDTRGSFTELLKTQSCGQISVSITKPGMTKGQHWHHSKWELFIVVAGKGLIQMRNLDSGEVLAFYVSGEKIEAVHMLPGYTHNIINLSDHEDLVTVMWANEPFDPEHPDTYFELVSHDEKASP